MPAESTCKIPFTTTGLGFAVHNSYIMCKEYGKNISECYTIHQLYRYTLAQFEYQCSRLPSVSSSNFSVPVYVNAVKYFPKNFQCIVNIIGSYGRFTEDDGQFLTVAPPVDVHSPHTVRLTNLRAIVERLSTGGDKDFMKENTIPGAIYNADGVLQNADDIMPLTYDAASFRSDAYAVQRAFSVLNIKYPGFITNCEFKDEGDCSALVSTALEKNGPYDSISPNSTTIISVQLRDWYAIHLFKEFEESRMRRGIVSYCGVWSEKLEAQWPLIKVRYPGSSKQLIYDCSWASIFSISHNKTESAYYSDSFTSVKLQPLTCRVPFTTTGLAFAVNDLYAAAATQRYFKDNCTIHQLYRYTLVQFEFQCYVVGQAQHQAHYYPYLDSFSLMYKRLNSSGVIQAYPENFESIVTIIDSYGFFQREKYKFGTIPPPIDVHHPDTIRVSNLRAIVEKLATVGDKDFMNGNTIPGAIYNADGVLQNPDEIMPANYDDEILLSDARAVRRAFQTLLRDEDEKYKVTSCKFSDKGKPSTLVSISAQEARDTIPPILIDGCEESHGKTRITKTLVESRLWYSIHPVNDKIMKFGVLSYCGVWSESLEKKWPDMKVRNPGSQKQVTMNTWNAHEKFLD